MPGGAVLVPGGAAILAASDFLLSRHVLGRSARAWGRRHPGGF